MSFTRVDQLSEISPLINGWFNPPHFTPDFSQDAWEQEYGAVHERVFECMQQAEAAMTGLAEEAFSMGEPFSQDRAVCVVVDYIDLLSPELLRQLQHILADTPQDYRIVIDGSEPERRTILHRDIQAGHDCLCPQPGLSFAAWLQLNRGLTMRCSAYAVTAPVSLHHLSPPCRGGASLRGR